MKFHSSDCDETLEEYGYVETGLRRRVAVRFADYLTFLRTRVLCTYFAYSKQISKFLKKLKKILRFFQVNF